MNWNISKTEYRLIHEIAQRASAMALSVGHEYSVIDAEMDLTAAHLNGCRLRLSELAQADKFNFSHDVFGIRHHINRQTGELENCFVPRFAEPEAA